MTDEFTSVIVWMARNPPDPNESVPLANHKGTMFGVTIPFHVLSWIVVCFRLHTRLRVVREPGWDDLFVFLAALVNLVSVIAFLGGTNHGVGHHLIHIIQTVPQTMIWLYITNAAYHTTTALIKVSLLLQYLRLFRGGIRRKVCIVLLVLVTAWGLIFSFMAWVPCFPVSGFWNRAIQAKCYGFGYRTGNEVKMSILAFAATNMFFDIAIFLVPLTEYFRQDLGRKQLLAMTGLFSLGSIVILMAVLRLWSTFKHSQNTEEGFDFTWWYPQVLIISCLEVDFAIMCASMPIFWPTITASWGHIFVTNEVRVTHHQLLDDNSGEHFEMNRANSMKTTASTEGLTRAVTQGRKSIDGDFDFESGKGRSTGSTQVEVQPYAQKSRVL